MSQLQVTGEAKIRDIQGPVVANDGVVTALDGAASQYVRGDGTLADFPTSSGGGSSVSYYLNSSVSQGTIGGVAYRELSKDPIIGAGTDIAISANGYVANYITDVNDPDVVLVPGGNFNCEFYFSVNNNTGNPTTYAELYKYDGTTFTLLGTSAGVPESINQGTTIAPYYFAIPVASAALSVTDRLAIRIYVNVDGRTVTLHTENGHLCQVVTTLSKGMVSLNNLTDQSQYLATGTSGTNFAIVSSGDTHTFNLPVASATNTGKLSSTDWSTFNGKQPAGNYVTLDTTQTITALKTFTDTITFTNYALMNIGVSLAKTSGTPLYGGLNSYANLQLVNAGSVNSLYLIDGDTGKYSKLSFNNAADYTYTFPASSGTIALTSQLTNGTVTSVGLSSATSGVTIGSSPITTSGTITLAIATASGSQNGLLSSTDWTTFNNKLSTATAASTYVPYTGATTNVNLGVYSLTANQLIAGGAGVNNAGTFTTYDGGVATLLVGSTGNLKFFPLWNPSIGARINAEDSAGSAYIPLSFFASAIYLNGAATFSSTISATSATLNGNVIINSTAAALSPLQVVATGTIVRLGEQSGTTGKQFLIGIDATSGRTELQSVWQGTSFTSLALQPSGGNVLIGSTGDNGAKLQVSGTATFSSSLGVNSTIRSTGQTDPASGVGMELFYRAADTSSYIQSYDRTNGAWKDVKIYGNTLYFGSQGTNNLTIASTGAATFSSSVTATFIDGQNTTSGSANIQSWNKATSGDNKFVEFYTEGGGGTLRGSIDYNRGSNVTRYNTTSDGNLKNIIGDSDKKKSIDILNSTKIREYSWKDDKDNKPQIGVIAQELYKTFKGAVSVGSDEELFGTENYKTWGVDKTAFTFHLIAGWQKHEELINDLQAQIEELKALINK